MENSSTSLKDNAGRSFRTFILTLSISLIVFSGIYYALTYTSSGVDSLDDKVGDSSVNNPQEEVSESVFKEIANAKPDVQSRQVLAGSTAVSAETTVAQTTQAADNLNTGTMSVTVGLVIATVFFVVALVIISSNPRRLALGTFEKSVTKDLD
jgi:hypothetical protein